MLLDELNYIKDMKTSAEAVVVSLIYKDINLYYQADLTLDDFSINEWKVFFAIAEGIIKEGKKKIDDVTFGTYLEKHPKLKEKSIEYGGYDEAVKSTAYVDIENFDGFLKELKTWNALLKLSSKGFIFGDKIYTFRDKTSEEIYKYYETIINDAFLDVDEEIKSYNAAEGCEELIDEWDRGEEVGLPLYNAPLLNDAIGGINCNGKLYGLGANTGVGKSTTIINLIMPTILKENKKMVMIVNEEDEKKIKRELIVWVANNHFDGYKVVQKSDKIKEYIKYVRKKDIRNGHFSPELREILISSAKYLQNLIDRKNITIIPLQSYKVKTVVKIIKKYSNLGVKLFVLDTFKESADIGANEQTWKVMERDARLLYDTIKPKAKNVGLILTYQLSHSSVRTRCLTNQDVGQSKSILDVFDCNLMIRKPFEKEYEDLKYFEETSNGSKIQHTLDRDKSYQITFITKNRFGESNKRQIVSEFDMSTNKYKDVGYTNITEDW